MQGFIRRANIAKYRELLATMVDGEQRRVVTRLLAEEEARAARREQKRRDKDDANQD